jgi:hypothetical protein
MVVPPAEPRVLAPFRVLALALLAPTLLLLSALAPGSLFLPHLPVILEPLASEHPSEAERAFLDLNASPADRIFPTLSDQIAARAELAHLDLPTWEPDLGLGVPLFANSIAGLCYPPNWLALALSPERMAGPLAWLSLVLGGLGVGLFLRRLGASSAAVALGIVGLQAGAFGLVNLAYPMKVDAALWLGFSLWAVEGLAQGVRRSGRWLFLATALALLAGFPPIAVFGAAAAFTYACVRASALGARALGLAPVAGAPRFLAKAALCLALGALASAWQLLPMVEASRESLRPPDSAAGLVAQSLPLGSLAGVLVPDFAGAPRAPAPEKGLPLAWLVTPSAGFEKALHSNPLEWHVYAGIALGLLGFAALVADPRRALVPALALLLCYAFAQGWPLVRWLYRVPGLGAGAPNRVLAVAWVLWPWLGALGLETLVQGKPRARGAVVAAGLALALTAFGAKLVLDPERFGSWLQGVLVERYATLPDPPTPAVVAEHVPLVEARLAALHLEGALLRVVLLGGAVATIAAATARRPRLGASLLIALALADGLWTARTSLGIQRPGELALFPPSHAIEAVRAAAGDGRVLRLDQSASGTADVERLARPNLLQVYGIADLTPWTVFTPSSLVELMQALDAGARVRSGVARLSNPALLGAPLLDLLRVTCVLAREPLASPRLEPVLERPGFCVYRRTGALPPARIVAEGVPTPSREALRGLLVAGACDPARQALLGPGEPPRPSVENAGLARIESVTRPAKNRLDLVVKDSQGGLLVMHEQWYPGWKATINGADARLLCVDDVYRGLWLPPGDLVIRTKYEPWSLRLGFGLCVLASLAALALGRRGWF